MSRAAQCQILAKITIMAENLDDIRPHIDVCHGVRVANDVHAVLCARQQNVDAISCAEETRLVVSIRSHQGQ
jgi:hypothetical protein